VEVKKLPPTKKSKNKKAHASVPLATASIIILLQFNAGRTTTSHTKRSKTSKENRKIVNLVGLTKEWSEEWEGASCYLLFMNNYEKRHLGLACLFSKYILWQDPTGNDQLIPSLRARTARKRQRRFASRSVHAFNLI
jgi:hypothetical protein